MIPKRALFKKTYFDFLPKLATCFVYKKKQGFEIEKSFDSGEC